LQDLLLEGLTDICFEDEDGVETESFNERDPLFSFEGFFAGMIVV